MIGLLFPGTLHMILVETYLLDNQSKKRSVIATSIIVVGL